MLRFIETNSKIFQQSSVKQIEFSSNLHLFHVLSSAADTIFLCRLFLSVPLILCVNVFWRPAQTFCNETFFTVQKSSIIREITATDGGNRSSKVELSVTVTSAKNQPPQWERDSYEVVIPENTTRDASILVRSGQTCLSVYSSQAEHCLFA